MQPEYNRAVKPNAETQQQHNWKNKNLSVPTPGQNSWVGNQSDRSRNHPEKEVLANGWNFAITPEHISIQYLLFDSHHPQAQVAPHQEIS